MHLSPKARNSQVQAMCRFIAGSVASERHSAIRDAFTQSDPDSCAIAQLSHPYPRHKCGSALRERAAWWLMPDDRARDDVLLHSCLSIAEKPLVFQLRRLRRSPFTEPSSNHLRQHRIIINDSVASYCCTLAGVPRRTSTTFSNRRLPREPEATTRRKKAPSSRYVQSVTVNSSLSPSLCVDVFQRVKEDQPRSLKGFGESLFRASLRAHFLLFV